MASSSKPTAVHFVLVFFILASAVLGLLFALKNQDFAEAAADRDKFKASAQEQKTAADRALEQIGLLKQLTGKEFETVGEPGTDAPNTVVGAVRQDFQNYAPDVTPQTYTAALQKLSADKQALIVERDDLRQKLNTEHEEFLALESKWKALLAEQKTARDATDAAKADADKTHEEQLASKLRDIETQREFLQKLQLEFDEAKEAFAKKEKELNQRITNLAIINDKLDEELRGLKQTSFEAADGVVRWVDHVNKLVWINLGEVDVLKPRTTFSVYTKKNLGVARGSADVKGSIEVTRILGPHMAEARVLKDDIYNPISAGDPIYTPLWSPGRTEQFAFVGSIHLDNDKVSDRRELHEIIAANGARIDNEVDDEGNRTGDGITEKTKFLVLGELPDVSSTNIPEEQKKIQQVYEHLKNMRQEAKEHGVRIISLNDFLTYIGYVNQRRLFKPGDDVPYTLKSGSRSASTTETVSSRTGTGTTSGAFSGNKRLKPQTSSGQTSKLYKSGGG